MRESVHFGGWGNPLGSCECHGFALRKRPVEKPKPALKVLPAEPTDANAQATGEKGELPWKQAA